MPFLLFLFAICGQAQLTTSQVDSLKKSHPGFEYKFTFKNTILPSTMILVGLVSVESDGVKFINGNIREEVLEHIDDRYTIDDFLQWAPGAAVYALNLSGIKGKHNFKDRTVIYASSLLLMSGIVTGLKHYTNLERPDHSSDNSFPSGHTATAFVNAEFLFQEYRDVSLWYGVTGYLAASTVGIYRVVNNRHWITDVIGGAGIGILSTKFCYFLHERIKFNRRRNLLAMPYYNPTKQQFGLGVSYRF